MSYDYEEELARAREIRRQQKQAKELEQAEKAEGSGNGEGRHPRTGRGQENGGREGRVSGNDSRAQENVSRGRENASRGGRTPAAGARDIHAREARGSGKHGGSAGGQKGRNAAAGTNKRKKRIITMIIAEIFTLFLIFVYAYGYKIYSAPQRPDFQQDRIRSDAISLEDIEKMKGYWMIAIFGVDSRGNNVAAGANADVNMICCINQDTGDIKLVSVFRDSYLNIDDKGTYNKINQAYAIGGPEQAVKALNKNLDLDIKDYITFNWKAVADAINILGGVDLELSPAEFKYINGFITETVKSTGVGSNHLKKSGMNHLDGVQAVAYGRLRLMDTDYARTERQRKIIQLAFEKAKKADYSVLNNILVVVLPQVATSLDFGDLTNVALNITKYQLGETGGFPSARGEANMGRKGACVVPATLEFNVKLLHQFLFGDEDYNPSDTVKSISARIASDTGVYKEGQVIGHVSTQGVLPKETKAPETAVAVTEEEETTTEEETDEDGNPVVSSTEETSGTYPSIGETDEFGNLVDGPDDVDPTYGPGIPTSPGESAGTGPMTPGTTPTGPDTRPTGPDQKPTGPDTRPTRPGTTMPSEETTGPGGRPGETTASGGPGGTVGETTAAVKPGGTTPETTTAASPGGSTGPGEAISSKGPGEV